MYIIEHLEKKDADRIPPKLVEFFFKNKSTYYSVSLSDEIPLKEQELMEETKAILAFLCRKYLCADDIKK